QERVDHEENGVDDQEDDDRQLVPIGRMAQEVPDQCRTQRSRFTHPTGLSSTPFERKWIFPLGRAALVRAAAACLDARSFPPLGCVSPGARRRLATALRSPRV